MGVSSKAKESFLELRARGERFHGMLAGEGIERFQVEVLEGILRTTPFTKNFLLQVSSVRKMAPFIVF